MKSGAATNWGDPARPRSADPLTKESPHVSTTAARSTKLDPSQTGRQAATLERGLRKLIVGQDQAIDQIVNVYQIHLSGMNCLGRPVGNFLFLGPTGTGKTRAVEATAETLVGDPRAVVKIDCAEFQHSHEIAKLIGSPPGYLGHRETHPLLSQEVLSQYHTDEVQISFVLFDEIEKASDSLWNLLLGILDKATLTLGDNRRVDFSQAMIFMTSNLGAKEMESLMSPGMGFQGVAKKKPGDDTSLAGRIRTAGVGAARKKFTPEFINRLDKIVVFEPLGDAELRRILELELNQVQERVFQGTPFLFRLTDSARDRLLEQGADAKYGARHLKRAIERLLVYPLANLISSEQVRAGDLIEIAWDQKADKMSFDLVDEGLPVYMMYREAGIDGPDELELSAATARFDSESRALRPLDPR